MTDAVSPAMREIIDARLKQIADEDDITILLAIESGSRAWGFHSPDSDYDVRFIYARPVDWHLKLGKKRDVVERPIDDELDLSGWDIGKALSLAVGSNAVVAEWLQSPIVYTVHDGFVADLHAFCAKALDRKSITWHYISLLARQQKRVDEPDGTIRLKRYFYMLRPILALRWMRVQNQAMPPMDMTNLCKGAQLSPEQQQAIDALIALKKTVKEKGNVGRSDPLIDALITSEEQLAREWLTAATPYRSKSEIWDLADDLNRKYVKLATP